MTKPWLFKTLTITLARPFSSSAASTNVAVKKVTKSNFESSLSDLRTRIKECDFVALDLEMTGVTSAPWRESFEFDRSDVRYLKVKDSAEKFAVVQVGICPFRWNSATGSFIAHPHNFYIFPRRELPSDDSAYEFLCQTTSINFLSRHQFDFNAWIHEGISYLSRAQEADALHNISSAYADDVYNPTSEECIEIPIASTADLLFTERMKMRFQEWRDGILRHPNEVSPLEGSPDDTKMQFQTVFFKMRPAIMLNRLTSHQLKLIKLVLRKHFKDLVYVRTNDENTSLQKVVVFTDSDHDKLSLMKEVKEDLQRSSEAKIQSAVGFRHVVDLLSSEQKLIVGHNCLLDIAHICCKFVGPLPSTMADFAKLVHKHFPYIIDTKHLINVSSAIQYLMKKSSKSLSSAFSLLCPHVSSASQNSASNSYVKVEAETDETGETGLSCWNSGAKHEAGYDAFMTGCVFAQACSHLGIKFETNSPAIDFARNDKLHQYTNILHPSWNSGTVINLSTGIETPEVGYKRKYPTIVFSNIVVVWGFTSKLTPKDLKDCISKVFGADSITSVFFLDSTAAFVQFSKQEYVNDFLIVKDTLEREDDAIAVLHPLAKLLDGGNTHAASYETYKEICGASVSKVLFADQAEAMGFRWKTKLDPAGGESIDQSTENPNPFSAGNQRTGRKIDQERSHHQVSCEDILESLRGSKPVHGRCMRST